MVVSCFLGVFRPGSLVLNSRAYGYVGMGWGKVNLLNYCDYHLKNRYF